MNSFCRDCEHRLIPWVLKEKFNKLNYPLFDYRIQPIDDSRIAGCTVKYVEIDWQGFAEFLDKKGLITQDEKVQASSFYE